jgi:predicted ester cyclase
MPAEANKELVRRHLDYSWRKGEIDRLDEVWSADAVLHLPGGATLTGSTVIKDYLRSAVPVYDNRELIIDEIIAERDLVTTRWTFSGVQVKETLGVPPTGKRVSFTGMDFYRALDGKLVEEWFEANLFGLLQQLGS